MRCPHRAVVEVAVEVDVVAAAVLPQPVRNPAPLRRRPARLLPVVVVNGDSNSVDGRRFKSSRVCPTRL